MAASMRALLSSADLIDLIVEVRDARVPRSTAVARSHPKLRAKPALVLLNRDDLALSTSTTGWIADLAKDHIKAFRGVGTRAGTLRPLRDALLNSKSKRGKIRVAVVGAPNTGKSSVINALIRRKRAVVENRAGVTRHLRWLPLDARVELLDTPGVLEPKIASPVVAWQFAACGILPETAYDPEAVVAELSNWIARHASSRVSLPHLQDFAAERGMLRRGGVADLSNAARSLLAAFREGSFGRITFELPKSEPAQ